MTHINDLIGVVKGLRIVLEAGIKLQQEQANIVWANSGVKSLLYKFTTNSVGKCKEVDIKDLVNKANVVAEGVKQFALLKVSNNHDFKKQVKMDPKLEKEINDLNKEFQKTFQTLNSAETIRNPIQQTSETYEAPIENLLKKDQSVNEDQKSKYSADCSVPKQSASKPIAKKKIKVSLSENSKERPVPASRLARLVSFGSLAAGLGAGTAAQYARGALITLTRRTPPEVHPTNALLSPANAERIVNTLCKVRGAALKLGQLLSIQDESVLSPELQHIFERVRQSADFMPSWQVQSVMSTQLGDRWMSHLKHFEVKPFAAASIGQVHRGILSDDREVAIKIQYPGVARGIHSDIDNLVSVLKVWNMFPKGLFIDNIVEVAKKELAWEVDYVREAHFTKKFKEMLAPYPDYYVPDVIDNMCAQEVITTELVYGTPLERLTDAPESVRKDIATKIMRLCLVEMFLLRCMQTDPNWANFMYDDETGNIILLDFGASREYPKEFMDKYIELVHAASEGDREAVLTMSRDMKFLTGYESKVMEEAHVESVMIMGEVFLRDEAFDFGGQSSTRRIAALVPTVLQHRLCAPPDEVYSLNRKLSGVFLLCSKLNVSLACKSMFRDVYRQYMLR